MTFDVDFEHDFTQSAFTCSKSTVETPAQCMKATEN